MAGTAAAAAAREVTRSSFAAALKEFRAHLDACDVVSIAVRTTGGAAGGGHGAGASWRRVLPFDTPETAYQKFRRAAESYELLQLAVCPFTFRNNRVVAFPYNFHLFPRDENNIGMPSYCFSCQPSYLENMARDGFDFSLCINDGLSYLSRVQESIVKAGSPSTQALVPTSSTQSVADRVFVKRIKTKIEQWQKACKEPNNTSDGSLVSSLRRLILAGEKYGSRPCLSVDVCSDRQVQLVLQTADKVTNDIVPLIGHDKAGAQNIVRLILTSSNEDKDLLLMEIQQAEDEKNLKLRGFREVVDLISASQKPIVSYNSLRDFTCMHSKFVGPLPPNFHEFTCSLRMVFPHVLDISHMWKQIGPLKRATNIQAALSYLQRQFFVPLEMEVPSQADGAKIKVEQDVLRITRLFSKLSVLLKINHGCQSVSSEECKSIEDFSNTFLPSCTVLQESVEGPDVSPETETIRRIRTENLVFLWGYGEASATELKHRLKEFHPLFSEEFDLRLVDNSCAVVLFSKHENALQLLEKISSESPDLVDFFSHGLKAASYDAYKKACSSGLWESDLCDAFDDITSEPVDAFSSIPERNTSETYWDDDLLILDVNEYLGS